MLTRVGERVAAGLRSAASPWGPGYALARTLLAASTLATLAASPTSSLFLPVADRPDYPVCDGVARFGLFCLASQHLDAGRVIAIALMVPVILGFFPRVLGAVHWWIAYSFQANATMVDGGDQIAAILALLLLPATFTDPRWNHWAAERSGAERLPARLLAWSGHLAVRVQVAIIYFHACVSKFRVPEWLDGTAIYYWSTDPHFGASGLVRTVLKPVVESKAVALIAWTVLAIELGLAIAIFMPAWGRRAMLWPGLLLHAGIAAVHGLLSFSLVMAAALLIHTGWRPARRPLTVEVTRGLAGWWRSRARLARAGSETG